MIKAWTLNSSNENISNYIKYYFPWFFSFHCVKETFLVFISIFLLIYLTNEQTKKSYSC